ncbi:MAG: YlmH/Sll1252 family protein [Lachnospiraceae bacterium]|nr:YlmH/Sll1252 family protein [Lachnospiraceae bacterium]
MEKNDEVLKRRIQDLALLADRRGCILYSDFLSLYEQNILFDLLQKFSWIHGETFGGYEGAERRMAAFLPSDASMQDAVYPISCIRIVPAQRKFAEQLSHRDILGALMNLGIERSKTGDIAVLEQEAFLFCSSQFASLVCDELNRIRHTTVRCTVCQPEDFTYAPSLERIRGSVASVRLDAVIALAFHASRSSLISLIEGGSVFVNGRLITTNAYSLKSGDLVSVRGHGRFRYCDVSGQSKKGRIWVEIDKYV